MISIIDSGYIDRMDSAFPTLVRLPDGDIICGFSRGGGAHVEGGTHCARSADGGRTWSYVGPVLPRSDNPLRTNHLRLSLAADGSILAYGQRDLKRRSDAGYEHLGCDPVLCRSTDGGRSWSHPEVIPFKIPGPYEISNPIVVTADGRWLAPAATFHEGRYGERVVLHESPDCGATWPSMHTVFQDNGEGTGYLEQKVIETEPGHMLAMAWVQDFANDKDLKNVYSFSLDGGRSWSGPHPTGIQGQTMTPIRLGGDRYLVLYNRRYGKQTIQMCLVRLSGPRWSLEHEDTLYDGRSKLQLSNNISSQEQIGLIRFGYPMGLRLDGQTVLAAFWCAEGNVCVIRWALLKVQ